MALFKSLEIDTLKVRNILITSTDNKLIPYDYHLYSKGDGTTYWSTGVNAAQFQTLSTNVSTYNTSTTKFILSTFSTLQGGFNSTFSGISTYATNLSTYSTTVLYVNKQISEYSTQTGINLTNNYTTQTTVNTLSTQTFNSISTTQGSLRIGISTLSSIAESSKSTLADLMVANSTIYRTLSTYTGSTFTGFNIIISTNYGSTQQAIVSSSLALTRYTDLTALTLNTGISSLHSTLSSNIYLTNSTLNNLTNPITNLISTAYFSSIEYTDLKISTLYKSTTNLVFSTNTSIYTSITNLSTSIIASLNTSNGSFLSTVSTSIGPVISTNAALSTNLSVILSTGVTANIYKTFTQLQSYSAGIVESTVSSANYQINSTITTLTSSYTNLVTNLTTSSFSYIIGVASSVQTTFNSTVVGFSSTNVINTSTFVGQALSTQTGINPTQGTISTAFFSQFLTSPSIIMHRLYNISTLSNVSTITGLSSIKASIVNLDLTAYTNFYMLVSDISSDVYYGLTYSTNATVFNKDITLEIDVPSSYANKFVTIDTGNLNRWLGRPNKIYNQSIYGLSAKPSPKIYLSTFMGTQLVQMRMTRDALYVKDIYTFPYKYTVLTITSPPQIPKNVLVSSPLLQTSSFMYKGSGIPVSWTTNDINLRLGVNFIGLDIDGSTITKMSGPYDAALLGGSIKAPSNGALCRYNRMEFGIYSDQPGSDSGNINQPGQVFATYNLSTPIYVVNPTINSKITIYNPSTLASYLQVSELQIGNAAGENILNPNILPKYASLTTANSAVFQGDNATWGIQNIFDGSQVTSFRGGTDSSTPDKNAYLSVELSSFSNQITPHTTLSTISIYGSGVSNPLFTMAGMVLKIENKNQAGIANGLFYSTIALSAYTSNIFSF